MEKEIWKDIPGYEGLYQVSSKGRVKSLERYVKSKGGALRMCKEKCLIQSKDHKGYDHVSLSKENIVKSYMVYKLVAMAFLSHVSSGLNVVVDHINNDCSDNRVCNLQLISNRENLTKDKNPHSGFTGAYKTKSGRYRSQITYGVIKICLGTFDTPEEAHQAYLNKLKELL